MNNNITPEQLLHLADKCDRLASLLRDTDKCTLLSWQWIVAQQSADVVDSIIEHDLDEMNSSDQQPS